LIKGKVAPTMSESFLQRLQAEQGIGKWFQATIRRRSVTRFGQTAEDFLLMELRDATESLEGSSGGQIPNATLPHD